MSPSGPAEWLPWDDPRLLEQLFEQVPCYVSVQDRGFRIVRANALFRQDFGDRIGEHCHRVYKNRAWRCENCPVALTFADGRNHQSEEVVVTRQGQAAHVIVNTAPIYDSAGRIAAVMEMSTNITAVKDLHRQLEASRERFRLLFDEVPCYIAVIGPDFRLVQSNRRFREDFGQGQGQHCYEVFKHRTERCTPCPVAAVFADGQVHRSQEVLRGRWGQAIHVVVYATPLRDEQGRITAVMEMATDITEAHQLRSQLADLGQLVAGLAHSIKGILMGLDGGVYVVDSGFEHGDPAEVQTGWQMVKRNVERISRLVFDLLYCARPRKPEMAEVSPGQVVEEVCQLFAEQARRHAIELAWHSDGSIPPIQADPKGMHSLLVNLLTNAIDACRMDTTKEGHRIDVTVREEPGTVVFEVADNGIGMSEETKSDLFSLFYSTKSSEGTGLGLLVSRKIVQEHGGRIDVESSPGRGSRFIARIPRAGPSEQSTAT